MPILNYIIAVKSEGVAGGERRCEARAASGERWRASRRGRSCWPNGARRREQCRADIAEARRLGDLTVYRELKRTWARFHAKDYYRDRGPPPAA